MRHDAVRECSWRDEAIRGMLKDDVSLAEEPSALNAELKNTLLRQLRVPNNVGRWSWPSPIKLRFHTTPK